MVYRRHRFRDHFFLFAAFATSTSIALAQVGYAEANEPSRTRRLGGDLMAGGVIRPGLYAGQFGLNGGARLRLSQLGWFSAQRPLGVQLTLRADYNYYFAVQDSQSQDLQRPSTHNVNLDLIFLARLYQLGLGFVFGPEFLLGAYGPTFRASLGPVIALGLGEPTTNFNVQLLLSWRPAFGSVYDAGAELRFDLGVMTWGLSFSSFSRALIDEPFASRYNRVVVAGGLLFGIRLPW